MSRVVTRRRFLTQVGLAAAATKLGALSVRGAGEAEAAPGPRAIGCGRIQDNIPGVTIPSPSDFGFAADVGGGTFVCSMFGPETGGFKACVIMTVEGTVTPGTLQVIGASITFSGKVDIFVFPDVFTPNPGQNLILTNRDYNVTAGAGAGGKGTMILNIPDVTAALGGDTGGLLHYGRIRRMVIR